MVLFWLYRMVEYAKLSQPYSQEIEILGTGTTVSTPVLGLTKDIFVVKTNSPITGQVGTRMRIVFFANRNAFLVTQSTRQRR